MSTVLPVRRLRYTLISGLWSKFPFLLFNGIATVEEGGGWGVSFSI